MEVPAEVDEQEPVRAVVGEKAEDEGLRAEHRAVHAAGPPAAEDRVLPP